MEIQTDWSLLQARDHLRKFGLALTDSDESHSVVESLAVCLIQHSSERYSSLTSIQDAVESFLQTETDQISFRLRLSEKLQGADVSLLEPLVKDVVSLIQQFDRKLPSNHTITTITNSGIVKIISKDEQEQQLKDLLLWQDGQSGRFSCIVKRRNMFNDAEDYALDLLRDIPFIQDILFDHLDQVGDEALEGAALDFGDELLSCKTPGQYLAAINRYKIAESDRWKVLALEELANFGQQLSEEMERDLKEEIVDCLARASEDTYLRRKKDYERAFQDAREREKEKEIQSRQLKEEMEANRKEIAELEANIEENRTRESEMEKEYETQQTQASNKKDGELQANAKLQQKREEFRNAKEALMEKKAETEAKIKRIQEQENQALKNAEKTSLEIDDAEKEKDSVDHTMQTLHAQLEEYNKNIAFWEKDQEKFSLQEQKLMTESQSKNERRQKEIKNVKKNEDKIKKLKEKNAWNQFRIALNKSNPPYQLVAQKESFLQRIDEIDQLECLIEKVTSELKLGINNFQYLKPYAKNSGTTGDVNEVRNVVRELLAESKNDFSQYPWRINGSVLLLSQIKKKMSSQCEEIHICASRVIYVDCDWTIPGTNVALSAPRIEIVGDMFKINTSGRSAEEFFRKKAGNAERNGENGDHGKNGAAGESAGNFTINCDHLSGGKLQVVAKGGKGADGQGGGDGREGKDGADGQDGEITDRPAEGIGFFNALFRPKEELRRLVKGGNGTAGQAGGSGGNGGAGGKGGRKGVVTSTITVTGQTNLTSVSEDGPDGQDGIPGQGAKGGGGGRNGRDRALAFESNSIAFGGTWKEECGDLELREQKNLQGNVLGYRIIKKSEDKGRASRGEDGENGNLSNGQTQRATASAKRQITNIQNVWSNDVVQQSAAVQDTTELTQLEAENRRKQVEIVLLENQEADINERLQSVKQQKTAIDELKTRESSDLSAAQQEASQLKEKRNHIQETIEQKKTTLLRNQQEAGNLNMNAEEHKREVEQMNRSAEEQKAMSDLEIGQMKADVSRAREETEAAEMAVEKSRQLVDDIKSDRIQTEQTVNNVRDRVEESTEKVGNNERDMEEARQHGIEAEGKLQKLSGMKDLKERILKKFRVEQQHRMERIAEMEGNTIPDEVYQNDDLWPSGLVIY